MTLENQPSYENRVIVVVPTQRIADEYNRKSPTKDIRYISPGQPVMGWRCGTIISMLTPLDLPREERQKVSDWLFHLRCRLTLNGQLISV